MPTVPNSVRHDLALRRLQVREVTRLSAHMTRIRLGGDDLASLKTLGPTDHIKLLVPGEGETEPEWPTMVDGKITFVSGRPPMRDYTIRRHHEDSNEIDIDIAVHGDGHVSSWVDRVAVGDLVGTGGPRGSHPMVIADNYVLVGDPSSLPSIARWLEELPESVTAQVLIAGSGPEDEIELASPADITVHWVHDTSAVPADRLAGGLDLVDFDRPDLYVWVGGEVIAIRAVRDRLRDDFGLPEDSYDVDGYWRRGETDYDHHRPLDD